MANQTENQQPRLNVYIGFDSRNDGQMLAYEVCRQSILANTKHPEKLNVQPLKLKEFISRGIYIRPEDPLASTEFTFTRFLVPYLNQYQDLAVFCDSDFLWECDLLAELEPYFYQMRTENLAVSCVQHDYTPKENRKMNNLIQSNYPRKNWSSLMIFNCEHPDTQQLTLSNVNQQTPAWLHRMSWAQDQNIGALPHTFNYIPTVYDDLTNPKVIHYSDGGPWHYLYQQTPFSSNWLNYLSPEQQERYQREIERQVPQTGRKKSHISLYPLILNF